MRINIVRIFTGTLALACFGSGAWAGNWDEFRRLVPIAQRCVAEHPEAHPKLAENVRKYESRLGEADAIAALNPRLADQMIAKPLRQLKEELARCGAVAIR